MPEKQFYTEVKQAWGNWLTGLAEWEWFVTMTFRDPPQLPGRGTWTKPGWGYAKKAWREFQAVTMPAVDQRKWVRCFEMQEWRGVPHIHALVAGVNPGNGYGRLGLDQLRAGKDSPLRSKQRGGLLPMQVPL